MEQKIFETDRLLVRRFVPEDLDGLHAMQSSDKVMRYTTGRAQTYEENKADLERLIGRYGIPDNDFQVWAVVQKPAGVLVGSCALMRNEDGEWEIGYRFDEPAWGKGFGTEICSALLQYARGQGCASVVAYVYEDNAASVRVLEKSGMVLDRRFFNEKMGCMDRRYVSMK